MLTRVFLEYEQLVEPSCRAVAWKALVSGSRIAKISKSETSKLSAPIPTLKHLETVRLQWYLLHSWLRRGLVTRE